MFFSQEPSESVNLHHVCNKNKCFLKVSWLHHNLIWGSSVLFLKKKKLVFDSSLWQTSCQTAVSTFDWWHINKRVNWFMSLSFSQSESSWRGSRLFTFTFAFTFVFTFTLLFWLSESGRCGICCHLLNCYRTTDRNIKDMKVKLLHLMRVEPENLQRAKWSRNTVNQSLTHSTGGIRLQWWRWGWWYRVSWTVQKSSNKQ